MMNYDIFGGSSVPPDVHGILRIACPPLGLCVPLPESGYCTFCERILWRILRSKLASASCSIPALVSSRKEEPMENCGEMEK